MTYRPGTYGLGALGIANDEPRIICDGCGLVYRLRTDRARFLAFLEANAAEVATWPEWKQRAFQVVVKDGVR